MYAHTIHYVRAYTRVTSHVHVRLFNVNCEVNLSRRATLYVHICKFKTKFIHACCNVFPCVEIKLYNLDKLNDFMDKVGFFE